MSGATDNFPVSAPDVPGRSQLGVSTAVAQQTLAQPVRQIGVGLHSGARVEVRLLPAAADTGRMFVRTDLPAAPTVAATIGAVSQTTLSTELQHGEAKVRTVEHLLATLQGFGVDNVRIEIDGPEVPLLDGSAKEWAEAIAQVGVVAQSAPRASQPALTRPLWVYQGDAFVAALPASELRFTYGIEFELPAIGTQWHSWQPAREPFGSAIAPARTFALAHQIDQLRAAGLIRGGSLENALVCGPDGWINPPLRFSNEPARHKLLDLVGDLSLLGTLPTAHFLAYKASHFLHTQLTRLLAQRGCQSPQA